MSEAYKKVGRGGAGNFYSKKNVEDVKGKGKAVVGPLFFKPFEACQFPMALQIRSLDLSLSCFDCVFCTKDFLNLS
jgi:hypothetical protein